MEQGNREERAYLRDVHASVVIHATALDGSALPAALGLTADGNWTKGDPTTPDQPGGPRHRFSGLQISSRLPRSASPEEHAAHLLAVLQPARQRLSDLRIAAQATRARGKGSDNSLEVIVWLVCTTADTWFPFDFSPELLGLAAELGARLGIEVFACEDEELFRKLMLREQAAGEGAGGKS